MIATEFGQCTWDELNVIQAGGNYGWPKEGVGEEVDDLIDPVQQWNPDDANPSEMVVIGEKCLRCKPPRRSTAVRYAGRSGELHRVVRR